MRPLAIALFFQAFMLLGCQSATKVSHFMDASFKEDQDEETASLLFQYKFVNPVEQHEVLIVDDEKKEYRIRVFEAQSGEGYVVNLPMDHEYAIASVILVYEKSKKELQLGKNLPLFKLSKDRLTRIRGFDIINDKDSEADSISIAPWDSMTDNLLIVQAAKRFQIPEKSIRTINIFGKSKN